MELMKKIIVQNVQIITNLLMIIILLKAIVTMNAKIIIILVELINIIVFLIAHIIIINVQRKRKSVLMIVETMMNIYMNIIIDVIKIVQVLQKHTKKGKNVQTIVQNNNLNIIIIVVMIAQLELMDYSILEKNVLMKFQIITIMIMEKIFTKYVIINVKHVVDLELIQIIIVIHATIIININITQIVLHNVLII